MPNSNNKRYIIKGKGLEFGVYDTKLVNPPMLFAKSEAKEAKKCCAELNAKKGV